MRRESFFVEEKRNKIESEIILIAFDLNKYSNLINDNPQRFQSLLNTQRLIRDIDQLHLIDGSGDLILSADNSPYKKIEERAINMVLNDDRPLKIINTFENKSAAVIRLNNYNDTFLYVVKLCSSPSILKNILSSHFNIFVNLSHHSLL